MEPWWAPYVMTGVVSLLVGLTTTGVTLWRTGKRESRRRHEDQDRADRISQRQAVARFLENSQQLARKTDAFKDDVRDLDRGMGHLNDEQLKRITQPRTEYYEGMLAELEVLELSLHDKHMQKSFEHLLRTCKDRYARFEKLSAYPEYLEMYNLEMQYMTVSEMVDHGPFLDDIVAARNDLIRAAQKHLSLRPAENSEGLYT